jgi:hypothetical protein
MKRLFASSKFWTAIFDAVISIVLYFVGKYAPVAAEDVKWLIITIQPIFMLVIVGIFAEDVALKNSGRSYPG